MHKALTKLDGREVSWRTAPEIKIHDASRMKRLRGCSKEPGLLIFGDVVDDTRHRVFDFLRGCHDTGRVE